MIVLMNPPFARSVERGEDRHAGGRHLLAALARLAPGGRLVAIMPESFSLTGSGRSLRAKADRQAVPRLDVLLAPGFFSKHGTGIAVRLLVYDKVRGGPAPAHAQVDCLEQLLCHVEALPERASPGARTFAPVAPRTVSLFRREARGDRGFPLGLRGRARKNVRPNRSPTMCWTIRRPPRTRSGSICLTGRAGSRSPAPRLIRRRWSNRSRWARSRRRSRPMFPSCRPGWSRTAACPRPSSRP